MSANLLFSFCAVAKKQMLHFHFTHLRGDPQAAAGRDTLYLRSSNALYKAGTSTDQKHLIFASQKLEVGTTLSIYSFQKDPPCIWRYIIEALSGSFPSCSFA